MKNIEKRKNINPRTEPSTSKAKGKISLTWQLLSNIFFVKYFPQYFQPLFEYEDTRLLDSSNFQFLTHIWNSEPNISLMPLNWAENDVPARLSIYLWKIIIPSWLRMMFQPWLFTSTSDICLLIHLFIFWFIYTLFNVDKL